MYPLPVYNGNTRARKMGPPRAFSSTRGNQPSMMFDALQGTIALGRGGIAPTFTNATVRTITDQDLVVRQVLSGEARFGGFRRVQNLLVSTGLNGGPSPPTGWSRLSAGGTETSAVSAIYAGHSEINFTATAAREIIALTVNVVAGHKYISSFYCSAKSGALADYSLLMVTAAGGTMDVNHHILSSALVAGKRCCTLVTTCTASGTMTWRIGVGTGSNDTGSVTLSAPMFEDVTGQSNQNPAEYVSVGVLSAPYQGANVDGVQYFNYLNGNTVASNVVTEATGAAISSAILGGYLPEPAATDLLLARADARDMTTANWTLGATLTRARTSVGADGVANKATRLTGGAASATNIITTTIVAAAASRTYSVLIKRVAGTNAIRLTQDNFATTLEVTGLINSSTYTLVQMEQSQLNPVFGIQVGGTGDAIDVDWNQYQTGNLTGLINSRIPDTISTRNADVLTYATTGWLNAAAGALYGEFFNPTLSGPYVIASLNNGGGNDRVNIYANTITTAGQDVLVGGAAQSSLSAVALTGGAVGKIITMYQANDFAGYGNNTTLGTDGAGTIPTVNALNIGNVIGANYLGHYIRKVAYYPTRMVNESAKALTA